MQPAVCLYTFTVHFTFPHNGPRVVIFPTPNPVARRVTLPASAQSEVVVVSGEPLNHTVRPDSITLIIELIHDEPRTSARTPLCRPRYDPVVFRLQDKAPCQVVAERSRPHSTFPNTNTGGGGGQQRSKAQLERSVIMSGHQLQASTAVFQVSRTSAFFLRLFTKTTFGKVAQVFTGRPCWPSLSCIFQSYIYIFHTRRLLLLASGRVTGPRGPLSAYCQIEKSCRSTTLHLVRYASCR